VGALDRPDFEALVRETASRYLPSLILAGGAPGGDEAVPLLRDRATISGRATAYVCRHYACAAPVTDPHALGEQLERSASGSG
jgi:uncharacterized protein YyaL (SSP411 family)